MPFLTILLSSKILCLTASKSFESASIERWCSSSDEKRSVSFKRFARNFPCFHVCAQFMIKQGVFKGYFDRRGIETLLKRTISVMTGKGAVNHNSRKFHAKNTDQERSCLNVEYSNENIKDI